jgi:hypothetical protein
VFPLLDGTAQLSPTQSSVVVSVDVESVPLAVLLFDVVPLFDGTAQVSPTQSTVVSAVVASVLLELDVLPFAPSLLVAAVLVGVAVVPLTS